LIKVNIVRVFKGALFGAV